MPVLVPSYALETPRSFPNTASGHRALIRWMAQRGTAVRVCLEATGLYGLDLALALHQAHLPVMIANPRAVRAFVQALMQRSKNDRLDAVVLRAFAARMPFQPWTSTALRWLQSLFFTRSLNSNRQPGCLNPG